MWAAIHHDMAYRAATLQIWFSKAYINPEGTKGLPDY